MHKTSFDRTINFESFHDFGLSWYENRRLVVMRIDSLARPGERRSMEVVSMLARDGALLQRIEEMRRSELAKAEEREERLLAKRKVRAW
jgi:hypothetical protein